MEHLEHFPTAWLRPKASENAQNQILERVAQLPDDSIKSQRALDRVQEKWSPVLRRKAV
jgi:hypothetical protein